VRFLPDDGARVAALESGEVARINNVPPDAVERLKSTPNLQVLSSPTTRIVFIEMICDRPPFDHPKVRKAMNYAVDRDAITSTLFRGMAEPARSVFYRTIPGYSESLPPYTCDPARAKQLLADAGLASGVTITFGYPSGRYLNDKALGEALTAQMKEAGFNVEPETGEWGTYFGNVRNKKYDAYILALGTITVDPAYATTYFDKGNPNGYNDPEVQQLLADGDQQFDVTKAEPTYRKVQELVWDHGPWAALYFQPEIDGASRSMDGFTPRFDEYLYFQDAILRK
jgi:peptide/nickel transport system substrate-binding protein